MYQDFTPLHDWIIFHCLDTSFFFHLFTTWWSSGLVPLFLASRNNAAMNSCVHIFTWKCFQFSCEYALEWLDHMVTACLTCWGTARLPHLLCYFPFHSATYKGFNLSTSVPIPVIISWIIITTILGGVKRYLRAVFFFFFFFFSFFWPLPLHF